MDQAGASTEHGIDKKLHDEELALQQELVSLLHRPLRQRGKDEGVEQERIDEFDDGLMTKEAFIQLVLAEWLRRRKREEAAAAEERKRKEEELAKAEVERQRLAEEEAKRKEAGLAERKAADEAKLKAVAAREAMERRKLVEAQTKAREEGKRKLLPEASSSGAAPEAASDSTLIKDVRVALFRIPLREPLVDAAHGSHTHFELVTVTIETAAGATGVGYTYTGGKGGRAILELLRCDLRPYLLTRDSRCIEALWAGMACEVWLYL